MISGREQERRVIPRWRDSGTTLATGELSEANSQESKPEFHSDDSLQSKLSDWKANRSIPFATDLISAAFVFSRPEVAQDAARFLVEHSSDVSPSALRIAQGILKIRSEQMSVPDNDSRFHIRQIRRQLRDEPRNALMWADLSRNYATLGLLDKAGDSMDIAVKLAPENRFTLRSAARLFVHAGDAERAFALLHRAQSRKKDPWLMAAEIAVATVLGRTTDLMKHAKWMLGSALYRPFSLSELASAVATLEMRSGNERAARRLFRQALIRPTDNTVAQVEWAKNRIALDVDPQYVSTPRSYEARSWEFFMQSKWDKALSQSEQWLDDEPFSTRPALLGSFVSAVALENYQKSATILRRGLRANPHDVVLLNNLTFALASAGNLSEASDNLMKVDLDDLTPPHRVMWLATSGLVHFRRGSVPMGRQFYQSAIELAESIGNAEMKAMAAIFLAREELLARTPECEQFFKQAVDWTAKVSATPVLIAAMKLNQLRVRQSISPS